MTNIFNRCKWMSSLAVFGELYDSKKDIYEIISHLLNELITSNSLYKFGIAEIVAMFNKTYEFEIPEAVVRTGLGRLKYVSKYKREFIVERSGLGDLSPLGELRKETEVNSRSLIKELLDFVRKEIKQNVNKAMEELIVKSLCSFLLDEKIDDEYTAIVSAFVLRHQDNQEFRKRINQIREGVILYSGLRYDTNLNEIGTWNTKLTIFLDTEIIFHFAGYNGKLYQKLFDDFYAQIAYVNNLEKKILINLKFFSDAKKEINRFFRKAEQIVEGKEKLNPANPAMSAIVEGCDRISEIQAKKADLFTKLREKGITEDEYNEYFVEKNYKYNLAGKTELEALKKELDYDIADSIRHLNFVAIRRKDNQEENFANIGYILMTGKSDIIKVAWHSSIKEPGNVPLASTLYWLTNKFWFKLNRGFGKKGFPHSMDAIAKAQVAISTVLNSSISAKYDELQEKFEAGEITEEQAKARIINLRSQVRKPEEIRQDDVSSLIETISEESIEEFNKEQEAFRIHASKQEEENIKLKEAIRNSELQHKQELHGKMTQAQATEYELRKKVIDEKEGKRKILLKQKDKLDRIIARRYSLKKLAIISLYMIYYIVITVLIFWLGWDVMEQWIYMLGIIPIFMGIILLVLKERKINPMAYLKKIRTSTEKAVYSQFNFDIGYLSKLEQEIEQEIINMSKELSLKYKSDSSDES